MTDKPKKKLGKTTREKFDELGSEPKGNSKNLDIIFAHIKENKIAEISITNPQSAIDYDPQSKSITQRISFLVLLEDLNT